MKTAQMMLAAVKVLILVITLSLLTGCGATFVKSGLAPLKGNETVGILIAKQEVKRPGGMNGVHISDAVDRSVGGKVAGLLKDKLAGKGFHTVVIPADEKVADILKKYKETPRNFRRVIDAPERLELGDLNDLFKGSGIDCLLVYEGESVVKLSALQDLAGAGTRLGLGLAFGVAVPGASAKATTITYSGVIERNGKFSYYNREQFTRAGDISSESELNGMIDSVVDGWLESRR